MHAFTLSTWLITLGHILLWIKEYACYLLDVSKKNQPLNEAEYLDRTEHIESDDC